MACIDPANVQGIIFQLYRYPLSRHFLFRVDNAAAARECVRQLLPQVTHAAVDLSRRPEPLINIGVSWTGLAALGIIGSAAELADATAAFPSQFRAAPPMNMENWNGRFSNSDVHLTVHVYCMSEAKLDEITAALRSAAVNALTELSPTQDGAITGRSLGGDRLHFGFRDGISQPAVKWDDAAPGQDLIDFRHFILGYASEELPSSPKQGRWLDLVRDGSYGAFLWIHQNVAAFERFLTENAAVIAPTLPLAEARELLAAKMMGRWRDGTPIALSPDRPDATLANATNFDYADDPRGIRCPLTAHVRIANHRSGPLTPVVQPTFLAGGPYVLRRGMAYGPELKGEIDDNVDRGLVGMFLGANLRTQFFTLMHWINKTDFSPLFDTDRLRWQDMMIADRATPGAVAKAAIKTEQAEVVLDALPSFVRFQGTSMLLLPGMQGLSRLAEGRV
ncbi:Dyp-type peroxidase [Bradyrhizobium genosp. A]|uniref:Dyp-type peroxidase n=1 Tax=Bradyrhizobium genosp. A TaxID=83626 RepID=UPI003CEEABBC